MSEHSGFATGVAIVLVLFILLVIILLALSRRSGYSTSGGISLGTSLEGSTVLG
ncbi:hypothetical protein [Chengkuizengella sediminis]|uniref:hypothetical protein n=1 Tax=Chengkuizengella sediminis TaxID=1885917 RepID=UPI00196B5370|nr:hypothetical protein [Chengkuizengella sediminis]